MDARRREPPDATPDAEPDGGPFRPKDRVLQTRVPRALETTLKREARRRRLTVSHLIRNVLEDAFHLVDGVVANVDALVDDSVELVRRVGSDARRVAGAVREAARVDAPANAGDELAHVWAWNRVVLNRATGCSRCRTELARGAVAWAGLGDDAAQPRAWLCGECIGTLSAGGTEGGGEE